MSPRGQKSLDAKAWRISLGEIPSLVGTQRVLCSWLCVLALQSWFYFCKNGPKVKIRMSNAMQDASAYQNSMSKHCEAFEGRHLLVPLLSVCPYERSENWTAYVELDVIMIIKSIGFVGRKKSQYKAQCWMLSYDGSQLHFGSARSTGPFCRVPHVKNKKNKKGSLMRRQGYEYGRYGAAGQSGDRWNGISKPRHKPHEEVWVVLGKWRCVPAQGRNGQHLEEAAALILVGETCELLPVQTASLFWVLVFIWVQSLQAQGLKLERSSGSVPSGLLGRCGIKEMSTSNLENLLHLASWQWPSHINVSKMTAFSKSCLRSSKWSSEILI